jgi:hypothetical protein
LIDGFFIVIKTLSEFVTLKGVGLMMIFFLANPFRVCNSERVGFEMVFLANPFRVLNSERVGFEMVFLH